MDIFPNKEYLVYMSHYFYRDVNNDEETLKADTVNTKNKKKFKS